jgi:hypothetical protein
MTHAISSSFLMLPTDGLATDPFRFSISDKKSTGNCAPTFLDLPKSYVWYPNRGVTPVGRGARRWPVPLKSLHTCIFADAWPFVALIFTTCIIAIFTP